VRNATSATTRHTWASPQLSRQAAYLLQPPQKVRSAETRLEYRIERLLGAGGFGQVFLARRLGRSPDVPEVVCIKVSSFIDGWVREAYFGDLLGGHSRAIRIYDRFPFPREDGEMLYCLAMEYAAHGDLGAHLRHTGKAFSESAARREIAGILQVLDKLHRGQMLHRDLTPLNVFVCEGRKLKLGDFGIARQQSDRRGITVRTLNPFHAPSDIVDGHVPKWQARDDVYQVGQLLGILLKGDAGKRIPTREVRHLPCSDHLKEIIHRCIGERRKRYESAEELIDALTHPPRPLKTGVLRSLDGAHLAFTGILSRPRKDAIRAATRAGAIVHSQPSRLTNVVVRGRPNAQQAAGKEGGLKLMEIKRQREMGHRITILNDAQFWKLASQPRKSR
jgi:serine/threonine protein kinase